MYYIGIDLGTSSVKILLVDENERICFTVTKEYPLYLPIWAGLSSVRRTGGTRLQRDCRN